jgi:hypothetical protein
MSVEVAQREFIPGTTGWCVDDLDDAEIERLWLQGRYEIVEGVLTLRAPGYFYGGVALHRLICLLADYTSATGLADGFATGVDLILNKRRLAVVDAVFLSPEDQRKQEQANAQRGRKKLKYGRILIAPTLIIESISQGHEVHDRETKRQWYAEARVPNYWLLDAMERSLDCLILDGADYRVDQAGRNDAELRPSLFPGLTIPLGKLWAD